jgi:tape measure domain-containing protein
MTSYIGSTYLNVVPKIEGLSNAVSQATKSAEGQATASGQKLGNSLTSGMSGSMTKVGVVAGAFSAVTSTAMNAVSSSLSGAISRFDALNNYPKVMTSLGYSSEEASRSINTMSDRLTGLPTALNDMTSVVQGIVAVTGDLDQATDAGLALNDMLLAGGASTQATTSAMEQFRQMLAKGVPELQDWRTLTSAMPGQMKQLAEEMLGAGASADDLYAALGGGKNEAILSMDDLMNAMIRLDKEGSSSITSFSDQAKSATGGIQTSLDNLSNAMNRGLASVFDSIGKENISGALSTLQQGITNAFKVVSQAVSDIMPTVKTLSSLFAEHFTSIASGFVTYKALSSGASIAMSAFSSVKNTVSNVTTAFKLASAGAGTLTEAFSACSIGLNPVMLGITAITAVIGVGVAVWQDYNSKMETAKKATTGLSDACSQATGLDTFAGTVENIGTSAGTSAQSLQDSQEAIGEYVDKINQTNSEAQSQISILNTAQGIIEEYAGKSDLSADAQGRVKWACQQLNKQLGLNIDSTNVQSGAYTDQEGNVKNLVSSIDELIQKKKQEIKANALQEDLSNAYKAQQTAQEAYVKQAQIYDQRVQDILSNSKQYLSKFATDEEKLAEAQRMAAASLPDYTNAKKGYEDATSSVKSLEEALGTTTRAAQEGSSVWDNLGSTISSNMAGVALSLKGISVSDLTEDLQTLGANTDDLKNLSNEDWRQIGEAYDGTCGSIADKLQSLGVKLGETAQNGGSTASQLKEAFNGLGEGVANKFSDMGINVDDFMEKCALAGVSTDELNAYGSENLQTLADNCDGDVNKMVACLGTWNMTEFVNKDGSVNVNTASLMDAQGNLYMWNGTQLVDKNGQAVVEDKEVTDATGNVWTWNGTELKNKDGWAKVEGNASDGSARVQILDTNKSIDDIPTDKNANVNVNGNFWSAGGVIWDIVNGLHNLFSGSTEANVNVNQNAKGGYRLNASGGYRPRYHASGAIATRAVPLDIVGEDGAEAIVPLTNKRYAMPFINLLADGLVDKADTVSSGNVYNIALNYSASDNARTMFNDLVTRLETLDKVKG